MVRARRKRNNKQKRKKGERFIMGFRRVRDEKNEKNDNERRRRLPQGFSTMRRLRRTFKREGVGKQSPRTSKVR